MSLFLLSTSEMDFYEGLESWDKTNLTMYSVFFFSVKVNLSGPEKEFFKCDVGDFSQPECRT